MKTKARRKNLISKIYRFVGRKTKAFKNNGLIIALAIRVITC
jgi:hypothetical protein